MRWLEGVDTEFCEERPTYKEYRCDPHPNKPEYKTRLIRLKHFVGVTCLVEEPSVPSFRHTEILDRVPITDHVSCWWIVPGQADGNDPDDLFDKRKNGLLIPIVMVEPYGTFNHAAQGLEHFELPTNMSVYCGAFIGWPGAEPETKSVLYAKIVHKNYLDEIAKAIEEASKTAPPWNHLPIREARHGI